MHKKIYFEMAEVCSNFSFKEINRENTHYRKMQKYYIELIYLTNTKHSLRPYLFKEYFLKGWCVTVFVMKWFYCRIYPA